MAVYTGKKMKFTHNGDTFILDPVSVFEYSDLEHFPAAGQAGKVYIALDTNVIYRWDETDEEYVPISSSGGSSALVKIPFTIAISDWSAITGGYTASVSNSAFTSISEEFITYTNSINTYLKGNLNAEKDNTDHAMIFVTEALPIGTIAGTIYSVANYNGQIGVVMVNDKLPIANGGTNANTAAGALANLGAIGTSEKGVANGVATLDSNGLIPASQLPSYVDDVLEYANASSFPATGETGKIYVALDTNKSYRWSGSTYVELSTYDVATPSSSGLMSATDKTNLDRVAAVAPFTGATSSAAGTSGYVPAPAIGDQTKVLTGNGTWQVSPGAKVVVVNGEMVNGSGFYVETILNNLVTADMKAIYLELGNPAAFLDQIVISTGDGYITITCQNVSGSSTIKVSLLKVIDDPTAITTTEYDELNNNIGDLDDLTTTGKSSVVDAINEVVSTVNDKPDNATEMPMSSSDATTVSSAISTLSSNKVTGPASVTANRVAVFDGTSGKAIKDSGYTIAKSVPSDANFTNTWRGIQNNLTSTSTTDSLSAAQGKVLKDTISSLVNQYVIGVTSLATNSYMDKTYNFPKTFSTIYAIFAVVNTTSTSGDYGSIATSVISYTNKAATVRFYSGPNHTSARDPQCKLIVLGI